MSYKPSPDLEILIDKLLGSEKEHFFESVGEQLPHTIRFNPLKGDTQKLKSFLEEQGFELELFPGFDDVYRLLYQPYPIGKSLSHFLGHFYVQDIASMLPPRLLKPQPGDIVLDMSAAPGSKTTQMAVMMQNRGMILANDIVQKRLRALLNNLQRLGIVNTAVVKNYGESFGKNYFETFDRILLDPACSGLGTLHKSPEVLSWWTPNHCVRLAASQRHLISSAIKSLKPGGILVYSTCTLTPEENEEIIDFALREFPMELEPIVLPGLTTRSGLTSFEGHKYSAQLEHALRLYPFENQTEGFFVARLRKTEKLEKQDQSRERKPIIFNYLTDTTSPVKKYLDYFSQHFGMERKEFSRYRYHIAKSITAVSKELAEFSFKTRPMKTGLTIGHLMTQVAKFSTEGVHLFGNLASQNFVELADLRQLEQFANRENLPLPGEERAQILAKYKDMMIGYGVAEDGRLKSQFPKAEWPFRILSSPKSE